MQLTKKLMIKMYTDMIRIRKLDEKFLECLNAGKLKLFYHSCQGQEAPGVALCSLLKKDDYLFYNHRGHGISKCLPRGISARQMIAEHFGKATGACGGFAGFHYANKNLGILGMGGTVGGQLTLAAGVGIACQLRGKNQVVVCNFGDGATGRGSFHEAMLMAASWKLPVIWFCENNLYQQWTCVRLTHPKENLSDFAQGFGIPSAILDGQDVVAVFEALKPAFERARSGKGPTFLEIKTFRYRAHAEGHLDYSVECPEGLRSQHEVEEWRKRDPIILFRESLLEKGILTKTDIKKIDEKAHEEMQDAEQFASESLYPNPDDMYKILYENNVHEEASHERN